MFSIKNIESLKKKIFELDNTHCFIEREAFLADLVEDPSDPFFYSTAISDMLASVSTPVYPDDIVVGHVLEGPSDKFEVCPSRKIFSKGHKAYFGGAMRYSRGDNPECKLPRYAKGVRISKKCRNSHKRHRRLCEEICKGRNGCGQYEGIRGA